MNEMLTDSRVTGAIKDYLRAEKAAPQEQPPIIDHPIDEQRQTGESRSLGGALEIKSPWSEP